MPSRSSLTLKSLPRAPPSKVGITNFALSQIRPLHRAFFARNPRRVARELLGKILVRNSHNHSLAARIVEVEAYLGKNDPAAHAAVGNTARNSVLFGPPGYAYVYFIYGNHFCLNVSCETVGKAGSVLFRALEPLVGIAEMAQARSLSLETPRDLVKLTSGPGRLAQAFDITRAQDNGCDLTSPNSGLWIGEDDFSFRGVQLTPRIGIRKAADQRLRYFIGGNAFVSGEKLLQNSMKRA
jgi:DNA-3-methyladenine glycosylase